MTYIMHVTLNSGHAVKQYRADVHDDTVAVLSDTLDALLQGAHMPVPGLPDYIINAEQQGHNLVATVWRGPWDERAPILTSGTALKSRSGPKLWRLLHETAPGGLATNPGEPPKTPWVADLLHPATMQHVDALEWTGDLSRSLAWTWFAYRGR